jgi:hypothetical protein
VDHEAVLKVLYTHVSLSHSACCLRISLYKLLHLVSDMLLSLNSKENVQNVR